MRKVSRVIFLAFALLNGSEALAQEAEELELPPLPDVVTHERDPEKAGRTCPNMAVGPRLDCLLRYVLEIDWANIEARETVSAYLLWAIEQIRLLARQLKKTAEGLKELQRLMPHIDKLVELADRGGVGLTPEVLLEITEFRNELNEIKQRLTDVEEKNAEQDERLNQAADALRFVFDAAGVFGGTTSLHGRVGAELCDTDGPLCVRGYLGPGITLTGGRSFAFVAGGDIGFSLKKKDEGNPRSLTFAVGAAFFTVPGPFDKEDSDEVRWLATLGVRVDLSIVTVEPFGGYGYCDERGRPGKFGCGVFGVAAGFAY